MPQKPASVEVVIPIYQTELAAYEHFALQRCVQVLGQYSISFAKPKDLNINHLMDKYQVTCKSFDGHYFNGIAGYNQLMLSTEFYNAYQHVDHILIHQLDALVFKDELANFCALGLDYIGAPWLSSADSWHKKLLQKFQSKHKKQRQVIFGKVGNGGFSLRNTAKCLAITEMHHKFIAENLKRDVQDVYYMEDVFWSLLVNDLMADFKVANFAQGLAFAFDRKPDIALSLNGGQLPFGCHGFNKPKVRQFWRAQFEQQFGEVPQLY